MSGKKVKGKGKRQGKAETPPVKLQSTSNSWGIAALVCGILGLLFMPFILSTLAVVFGALGMKQNQKYAKAGLILGIIGLALMLVMLVFLSFFAGSVMGLMRILF